MTFEAGPKLNEAKLLAQRNRSALGRLPVDMSFFSVLAFHQEGHPLRILDKNRVGRQGVVKSTSGDAILCASCPDQIWRDVRPDGFLGFCYSKGTTARFPHPQAAGKILKA